MAEFIGLLVLILYLVAKLKTDDNYFIRDNTLVVVNLCFGVLLWLMHTGEHRCFCINRLLMQQMLSACWACLTCRRAAMAGRDCNRDSKPGFVWGG